MSEEKLQAVCRHCGARIEEHKGAWWTADNFQCPDGEHNHAPAVSDEEIRASHPEGLCDDQNCRQCWLPPCPKCKGKGELVALNPHGMTRYICTACGGCGAQL